MSYLTALLPHGAWLVCVHQQCMIHTMTKSLYSPQGGSLMLAQLPTYRGVQTELQWCQRISQVWHQAQAWCQTKVVVTVHLATNKKSGTKSVSNRRACPYTAVAPHAPIIIRTPAGNGMCHPQSNVALLHWRGSLFAR